MPAPHTSVVGWTDSGTALLPDEEPGPAGAVASGPSAADAAGTRSPIASRLDRVALAVARGGIEPPTFRFSGGRDSH